MYNINIWEILRGDILKKLKSIILIFITIATVFFNNIVAFADDDGYYIKNMKVEVEVNDARQYIITETIDVYFNENRHGIIRKIPISDDEDYSIKDISVANEQYEVESNKNEVKIKIGNAKKEVKGKKRYIINYTLDNYADELNDGDYVYLNILGAQWDTTIKKYKAIIKYPEEAKLERFTLYSGEYGDDENDFIKIVKKQNKVVLISKDEIPANNPVTIYAKFNEGAFKNAKKYQYPFVVKNNETNIKINNKQEYLVSSSYIVDVLKNDESCTINLWDDHNLEYKSKIEDVKINNKNIIIDKENNNIILPKEQGRYEFNVQYKVIPVLHSDTNIIINSWYKNIKVEKLNYKITSYSKVRGIKNDISYKDYDIVVDDNVVSFKNSNDINKKEAIYLNLDVDKNLYSRNISRSIILAVVLGATMCILNIFIYFKYCRKKKIPIKKDIYTTEFNSAEVGYIIKGRVANKDILSLIPYWGSKGYLKIESVSKKKNIFKFTKLKDLDENHKDYEKKMFNSIFNEGDGTVVTTEQLKGIINLEINKVKNSIPKTFEGKRSLNNIKTIIFSVLSFIISLIPIVVVSINKTLEYNESLDYLIQVLAVNFVLSIILYCASIYVSKTIYYKEIKLGTKFILNGSLLSATIISFITLYSIEIPIQYTIIITVLSYINILVSGFMPCKSEYAIENISNILGFKYFINNVEKKKIEAMIEEEGEVFYDILPYTEVLGISSIWCDKFKDITMMSPKWYYGSNTDTGYYDYYMITAMTGSLNSIYDDVSTPPQNNNTLSNNNSYFSGGFSGGGTGGGGGSSW